MTVAAARSYLAAGADQILVVDNGSHLDIAQELVRRLPRGVGLCRSDVNLGYARGMNLGLRQLNTDIAVASNNDLEVSDRFVAELRSMEDACLLFASHSGHPSAGRPYPTILRAAMAMTGAARIHPDAGLVHCKRPDWYEGACLAATVSTWVALGYIPERHFVYGEELLTCRAADRRGIQVRTNAAGLTSQINGASTGRRWHRLKREEIATWAYWENVIHEWPYRGPVIVFMLLAAARLQAKFRTDRSEVYLARAHGLSRALRREISGPNE